MDSDMEDKYDVQVKKEKKKKKSRKNAEVDDYEEIDTTDVTNEAKPASEMASPEKPVIKQITFDLDTTPDGEFIFKCMENEIFVCLFSICNETNCIFASGETQKATVLLLKDEQLCFKSGLRDWDGLWTQ